LKLRSNKEKANDNRFEHAGLERKRAHINMAENLAPFAALVLVAHVTGAANAITAMGAAIFFWSRLAHALMFIAGLPWVRTLAFVVGVVGELLILTQIL
jgi:uncharacterized MAPEG superfamily protein